MGTQHDDEQNLIIDQIQNLIEHFRLKKIQHKSIKTKLISIGKTSGFLNDSFRKQAWTILVDQPDDLDYSTDLNQIQSQQYYEQIKLDVIRTLKRFPPNYSESDRHDLQDELIVMITQVLLQHPELHYYQGYHDISLTFLLVLGKDRCLPILDSITMSHLKFFLEPTMFKTNECLSYLMPLINCINSECAEYMQKGEVGHVIFALPWFITWFSHVLDDLELILRLYDLFVVSHFLMPVYVAAEIVDYHGEKLLTIDCEMSSLHQFLSSLATKLDAKTWEEIIQRALYLFDHHPPETLDDLQRQWKIKCELIENSPSEPSPRRRSAPMKTKELVSREKSFSSLSSVAFWGVTITVGGLAVFLWNHTEYFDSDKLFQLGSLLKQ